MGRSLAGLPLQFGDRRHRVQCEHARGSAAVGFCVVTGQDWTRRDEAITKIKAAIEKTYSKKGDEVVTAGGVMGTIAGLKNDTVILKVDDNTKLKVQKSAVTGVLKSS